MTIPLPIKFDKTKRELLFTVVLFYYKKRQRLTKYNFYRIIIKIAYILNNNNIEGRKMKKFRKLIIFTLTICITISTMTGCLGCTGCSGCNPFSTPEFSLTYTLNQADIDSFNSYADESLQKLPNGNPDNTSNVMLLYNLVTTFSNIAQQYQIAQVLYFADLSNEANKTNYDFASDAYNKSRTKYNTVMQKIYEANGKMKEVVFEGTDEDWLRIQYHPSDELKSLREDVNALYDDYIALPDQTFDEQTGLIYADLLTKYKQIATITGFEDYYDYGSYFTHNRNYEKTRLAEMKAFIKTYFIPLFNELYAEYTSLLKTLTVVEKSTIATLSIDYNLLSEKYFEGYVNSLPASAKDGINNMFKTGNYLIATSDESRSVAYTTTMVQSQVPYCFFGKGVADSFTIAHETGHYYSMLNGKNISISTDISEIQSQANEMLFLRYLEDLLSDRVYRAVELTQILDILSTVIGASVMDDFEQAVFAVDNVADYTYVEFDAIMTSVVNNWGADFFAKNFSMTLTEYWKKAIVTQPTYYISYAVSAISAIGTYCETDTEIGYSTAKDKYVKLCEGINENMSLIEVYDYTEILSPFEESTFKTIYNGLSMNVQTLAVA